MHRQHRNILLSFLVLTGLLAALPLAPQYAQSKKQAIRQSLKVTPQQRAAEATAENHDSLTGNFVITVTPNGKECRPMTVGEELEMGVAEPHGELRDISENSARRSTQTGLKITLRGTQQLEGFPEAKAAFQRAAAKWEAIIKTPITVILDVDFGTTRFGTPYPSGVLGSTGVQPIQVTGAEAYLFLRESLLEVSATPQQTAVYNALPANTLPTDLGPTTNFSGPSANLRALGIIDPIANPAAEPDIGNPPSIGFNSNFAFDFDPSNGIDADKFDFDSTAVHEIGHALGFTTSMGNKEVGAIGAPFLPTVWDLFRFRPGGLVFNSLGTRQRVMVAGGEQTFFAGGDEFGLATGTPAGTNGDGNQGSHWKDFEQTGAYVGIMDPTGARGERLDLTAADLIALNYFGFQLNNSLQVFEQMSIADFSVEEAQDRSNALVVNRFTPQRYPAKLESVRVPIPAASSGIQTGQPLRIIVFADSNRTGQPPANPSLLLDRTINLPTLPTNRIYDLVVTNGPTINSGDLYVGVQTTSAILPIAADVNGSQQGRSFISSNNGASFQPLMTQNAPTPTTVNFALRAYVSEPFNTPVSTLAAISPAAVTPGSAAFTLTALGSGFQPNSVVRVGSSDRTTAYLSGSQLQAQIPATDVASAGTLKISVFTPSPGGGQSTELDLVVGANQPLPTITRLDPPGSLVGANNVTLNVFGTNFNAQSRIRVGGNERTTTLVSSTQLSTVLTQTDLASSGQLAITVVNPAPGGGTSNAQNFVVTTCSFTTSSTGQIFPSFSTTANSGGVATSGFILNVTASSTAAAGVCPWVATVSEPWATFISPTTGTGRSVLNYTIQPQPTDAATPRNAQVTVGGRTVALRQLGRAAAISAASFAEQYAPNGITSIFGVGLARETRSAETTTLPTQLATTRVIVQDANNTQRLAPLFFVSAGQINFLIPQGTVNGAAIIIVEVDGLFYADSRVTVTTTAPSLFTANANGSGAPAAVLLRTRADNSQVFETVAEFDSAMNRFVPRPIDFVNDTDRLTLVLFGTGIRGRASLNAVSFSFADVAVPVQFAGAQGDLVGLDQVNIDLPRSLRGRGTVNLTGTVDGRTVNTVMVAFR
jgi:uncharacterized protein (TIGR03437 family)